MDFGGGVYRIESTSSSHTLDACRDERDGEQQERQQDAPLMLVVTTLQPPPRDSGVTNASVQLTGAVPSSWVPRVCSFETSFEGSVEVHGQGPTKLVADCPGFEPVVVQPLHDASPPTIPPPTPTRSISGSPPTISLPLSPVVGGAVAFHTCNSHNGHNGHNGYDGHDGHRGHVRGSIRTVTDAKAVVREARARFERALRDQPSGGHKERGGGDNGDGGGSDGDDRSRDVEGGKNGTREGLHTTMGWSTTYTPLEGLTTPVFRGSPWGSKYINVLFEWDTFLASIMAVHAGDRYVAISNLVRMVKSLYFDGGYVMGFWTGECGEADKSKPPLGGMAVETLMAEDRIGDGHGDGDGDGGGVGGGGDAWVAELVFDQLLLWNRWWLDTRGVRVGGELMVAPGSTRRMVDGDGASVNCANQAPIEASACETGLDNR